jgi:hypothetical protein
MVMAVTLVVAMAEVVVPAASSGIARAWAAGCATPSFSLNQLAGTGPSQAVAVGDFNHDGFSDMAVASYDQSSGGQLQILLGDGAGGFSPPIKIGLGDLFPTAMVVGDWNGDGNLDLVVIGGHGTATSIGSALIMSGDGTGNFNTYQIITLGRDPSAVTAADLNGDGHLDLAITNEIDQTLSLLQNDSSGYFSVVSSLVLWQPSGPGAVLPPPPVEPTSVVAVDTSQTGHPDIYVGNGANKSVTVFTGDLSHGFQASSFSRISTSGYVDSLTSGDIDRDGRPEVIAGLASGDLDILGKGVVSASPGDGSVAPASVAVADVNGDGNPDLIVGQTREFNFPGSNSPHVAVLLGDGQGNFGPPTFFPTGGNPLSVAVNEFDGDGAFDIALANEFGSAAVLQNTCALPPLDISATGIEVTQGIQDLANSVPLIAGKSTVVRVYANTTSPVLSTTARLYAYNSANQLLGELVPGNPGMNTGIPVNPQRKNVEEGFYFYLPNSWTTLPGPLKLTAVVNPFDEPAETDAGQSNNTMSTSVSFTTIRPLDVRLFSFPYINPSPGTSPTDLGPSLGSFEANLESKLIYLLPVSAINFSLGPTDTYNMSGCWDGISFDSEETCLLEHLLNEHQQAGNPSQLWYGLDLDAPRGGGISTANDKSGGGPGGDVAFGAPSPEIVAHEFGHLLGREHTYCSGAEQPPTDILYPYPGGRIGGPTGTEFYGFDLEGPVPAVVPPSIGDLMSYCRMPYRWPSDYTWKGEISYLQNGPQHPDPVGDFLSISGSIDASTPAASLATVTELTHVNSLPALVPGHYHIRLFDASNAQLADDAFTPVSPDGESASSLPQFHQIVALVPGTRRLAIYSDLTNSELVSKTINPDPPTVSSVSASSGTTLPSSGPVTITWSASDPDTTSLTYQVLYSADGGSDWFPLVNNLTSGSYSVDSAQLPGTRGAVSGEFEVVATDGTRTGQATTGPLAVPDKAPIVQITTPTNPATFTQLQTVPLKAIAVDPQAGTLSGSDLTWSSDIHGPLGTGSEIDPSQLSVGVHHITVTATGPTGLTSSATVIVNIQSQWNAPPTLTLPGDQTVDFHDPFTFNISASDPEPTDTLTLSASGLPAGLGFVDNGDRTGTVSGTVQADPGTYPVTFSVSDGFGPPVSATLNIVVVKEETQETYTGQTLMAIGGPAKLSATLTEDGTAPIANRQVTFTLGTGPPAQTCTGTTDTSGSASCTVNPVTQPNGPGTVSASFAGDVDYLPASSSTPTLIFSYLSKGSFVIGDTNNIADAAIYFWGSQWSAKNTLSGGVGPAAFKGYALSLAATPPRCGTTWSTPTGNSPPPPTGPLPSYMALLVANHVSQSGTNPITGNGIHVVVVKTNAGYANDPSHPGTGTVVATVC